MHKEHSARVDPTDERYVTYKGRRMLRVRGADGPAPVSTPISGPTISGNLITVDEALNNPTRITRDIAALADKHFFANKVFGNAGGVEGGAVLYELPPATATDLFSATGFQEVTPLAEFPEITFIRGVPVVAKPRKIGGKFPVSKEARKRNNTRLLMRAMTQAANTIALTLDSMAIAVLQAAITANTRTQAGQSWATAAGVTIQSSSGTNQALADILIGRKVIELEERGRVLNSLLIHPNQELSLSEAAVLRGMTIDSLLAASGITSWYSSARITAGTAILFDSTNPPGGWATEFPLSQDTWYENEIEADWYQWSVSPAMFVDDPYGILQLTGIA